MSKKKKKEKIEVLDKPPIFYPKKVKITTEGCMNATWRIQIDNIRDCDLHRIEMDVLAIFGRKKKKLI